MIITQKLLNDANNDRNLPQEVITFDDTCIYGHDINTQAQLF